MSLRFLTAGESHGPELNIILDGIPANMPLLKEDIDRDLARRQLGYGRGARMKIEKDQISFTGGIRHGRCFGGAPVAMKIINRDHEKWLNTMSSAPVDESNPEIKKQLDDKFISRVRPGHADLAGTLKYNALDVRDILERSSARETTSRVAVGAVCRKLLSLLNIEIFSHVLSIGEVEVDVGSKTWWQGQDWTDTKSEYHKRKSIIENSELRIYDPGSVQEKRFTNYIDEVRKKGDTLGGVIEIFALGVPLGLGSHVEWDKRIDGIIAQSLMSVHTAKSVEIGIGVESGRALGSQVHDQIYLKSHRASPFNPQTKEKTAASYLRYTRFTNNLGGIEGGMTNGMPITAKVGVKPIPTLVSTLDSIDLQTREQSKSHFERSDVCVVPAAGVVLESMLAFTLAQAILEKFGGDSMEELQRNYQGYLENLATK